MGEPGSFVRQAVNATKPGSECRRLNHKPGLDLVQPGGILLSMPEDEISLETRPKQRQDTPNSDVFQATIQFIGMVYPGGNHQAQGKPDNEGEDGSQFLPRDRFTLEPGNIVE